MLGSMEFAAVFWVGFLSFIVVALIIDLGVFNKKAHVPTVTETLGMTAGWFLCAMLFCLLLHQYSSPQHSMEFLTGYLVELSLSMDNVFVIALLFTYFKVPIQYQHRVLFWGIIGAIIMRFLMIWVGVVLIQKFHFIFYIFGALMIISAYKMITLQEQKMEPEDSALIKFLRSHINITPTFQEDKFIVREKGRYAITPLFIALVLIEKADLIFAVDSIPAIMAITQNGFIVFTSNIFAIIGLRSLYFLLAGMMDKFVYLCYGLAAILGYIGVKMILMMHGYHLPLILSLAIIITSLGLSISASLLLAKK